MRLVSAMSRRWALLAVVVAALATDVRADTVVDFYRGKTIRLVIGYGPAGGYDIYGRLAAEFLGRHIPGHPTIIAVNMPGSGSLKAVEYLHQVAPQDGTQLGSVMQQLALTALVDDKTKINVARFNYVGRFTSNIDIAVALPRTGITSFEEVRRREVVLGADQAGSMSVVYAKTLNAYGGAKLKIIRGYPGSAEIQLAAERGEVEINGSYSLPGVLASHPDWVRDKTVAILYQNALKRFRQLEHVPTVLELMLNDDGRKIARVIAGAGEIGRSIIATPGVPPERLAALRSAFQAMVKDPEFLAATTRRNLLIDPASGEEMDAIIREAMNLPAATVMALKEILQN
jgi:tripartite-type tricarboxylate transporter receptor subunit TctC